MSEPTASDLAADVRAMLPVDAKVGLLLPKEERGLASLDALVARVDTLTRERDERTTQREYWVERAEAAKAEVARLREERNAAAMWFENHMVDEDGKPDGLTVAGMLNYVYGWGLSGWAKEKPSYREARLVRKWEAAEAEIARLEGNQHHLLLEVAREADLSAHWFGALLSVIENHDKPLAMGIAVQAGGGVIRLKKLRAALARLDGAR